MYSFIQGGVIPKNYSDEGGGGVMQKNSEDGGRGSYDYTPLNPISSPYPIKNERSLMVVRVDSQSDILREW